MPYQWSASFFKKGGTSRTRAWLCSSALRTVEKSRKQACVICGRKKRCTVCLPFDTIFLTTLKPTYVVQSIGADHARETNPDALCAISLTSIASTFLPVQHRDIKWSAGVKRKPKWCSLPLDPSYSAKSQPRDCYICLHRYQPQSRRRGVWYQPSPHFLRKPLEYHPHPTTLLSGVHQT